MSQIERDVSQIADSIDRIIDADQVVRAKAAILVSVPGIARVTACAILIDMSEIRQFSSKQAAKLAGLAQVSEKSGKWPGKEHILGGRAGIRYPVYLPAAVARRFNPDMKAKYEQLVSIGKCKTLAITAIMRKLIVMAKALLRDGRKWDERPA